MSIPRAFAALLLLLFTPLALAQATPSFDCRKAASAPERLICKDPQLAKLDARLAAAYAAKRRQLAPAAAKVLQASQNAFLSLRDERFALYADSPKNALATPAETLEERIEEIKRIAVKASKDSTGYWENLAGGWSLMRQKDGRYRVKANAVEPVNARGVCNVEGIAHGDGKGGLLLDIESGMPGEKSDRYRLLREGNVLRVKLVQTGSEYGVEGSCGIDATLVGDYLVTTRPASFLWDASGSN